MSRYSTLSFISQGDAASSFELRRTPEKGISEIKVSLYGGVCPLIDVAFEYRMSEFERWREDAVIVGGRNIGIEGNVFRALGCSQSGETYSLYWNHLANGIPDGSQCEIAVRILPSPSVFLRFPFGTYIEKAGNNEKELSVNRLAVNTDRSGNLICLSDETVDVVSREGVQLASFSGFSNPKYASQKPDLNYLVLDSGNNSLVEMGSGGGLVRSFNMSAHVDNPGFFWYDDQIQTVLVSGGQIPKVYEFTWGDDYGTLLWSHGQVAPGTGQQQLDSPYGVAYGNDRSLVYVADLGNNRLVRVDRKTGEIVLSETVEIDGVQLTPNLPKFVCPVGEESVVILESKGEEEKYSRDPVSHPAIRRFMSSSGVRAVDKNDLPNYSNFLFRPILNTIFKEFKIDSSSASSLNSSSSSESSVSSASTPSSPSQSSQSSASSPSSVSSGSSVSSQSSWSSVSSVSSQSSASSASTMSSLSSSSKSSVSSPSSISSPSSGSSQSSPSSASSPSSVSSASSLSPANLYISAQGFAVPNEEWIEISNSGEMSQDMTGWKIVSHEQPPPCAIGSPVVDYTFPSGFVLNGGASVKVTSGPAAVDSPPTKLR